MNKLICQKCGGEISNDFNNTLAFCTNCGASVQSPLKPQLGFSPPKSNSGRYVLVFLGLGFGMVLLGAIGILGYWYWSKNLVKQYHCTIAGEPEPQTSEEYGKRAAKHLADNNYSADFNQCAFDAASEAIRLDSKNADALALRGKLYKARAAVYRDEKPDADKWRESLELALEDLNEAIKLAPDRANFYEIRVSIYDTAGFLDQKGDKTLADLTKAIELSAPGKSLAALYVQRGDFHAFYKNYENAVKDYTEAIKLDSENPELYSKRSAAYMQMGKEDLSFADHIKGTGLKDRDKPVPPAAANTTDSMTPTPTNQKTVPKIVSGGVINGKAVSLPKPAYPPAARAVRASGAVNVQVTVDEKGDVVSAKAVSGHPLLRASAESAARSAKFSPTTLSGTAVKVTGVIVYNFVPE